MMEALNELCNFIDQDTWSDPESSFAGWRRASPTGGRPESPESDDAGDGHGVTNIEHPTLNRL
jgi:hypothetical protein